MDVRFGLYRKLSTEKLMLLNCGVGEDSWESLGQQGDTTSPSWLEISPEYSLEGLMLKLKLPILWPPNAKNWLVWKDPDAGKDWGGEEKGTTEDEMVWWYHLPDGHEFEQAPGDGDGQGGLLYYSPWCGKESDMTEQLNINKNIWASPVCSSVNFNFPINKIGGIKGTIVSKDLQEQFQLCPSKTLWNLH